MLGRAAPENVKLWGDILAEKSDSTTPVRWPRGDFLVVAPGFCLVRATLDD